MVDNRSKMSGCGLKTGQAKSDFGRMKERFLSPQKYVFYKSFLSKFDLI
jgi:hypothetical protein